MIRVRFISVGKISGFLNPFEIHPNDSKHEVKKWIDLVKQSPSIF